MALMLGRLVRGEAYKGHREMIAAWGEVLRHVPDAELWIAGDGDLRPELERWAAGRPWGSRIRFCGLVSEAEKERLLTASRCLALPSRGEGFGLVYLEAMAAGLPVITSDHGGQVDFLRDGENGYLVPPSDEAAIARAIGRLKADPETERRIRANNLRDAEKHRSDRCAGAYEALFEKLRRAPVREAALATAETQARRAPV
jgi:phosphatidylinositol alpha-1,6-mannosyltransferase